MDIEAVLAHYRVRVPPMPTARQMAEPPKLLSVAEAYRQWWAEQRRNYCPESCTGSDRTTRLSWLAFIEAEMADALWARRHEELLSTISGDHLDDDARFTAIAALFILQDRATRLLTIVWP